MQVTIYIRKNDSGETRSYEDEMTFDDQGSPFYIWEEGNYSCDCNRTAFFMNAADEDDPDDIPCSDGKYSVNIEANGEIIYREFE